MESNRPNTVAMNVVMSYKNQNCKQVVFFCFKVGHFSREAYQDSLAGFGTSIPFQTQKLAL